MAEEAKKISVSSSPPADPSPNDNRSNTFNPNNSAHGSATNNRSNQMNPNNPPLTGVLERRNNPLFRFFLKCSDESVPIYFSFYRHLWYLMM